MRFTSGVRYFLLDPQVDCKKYTTNRIVRNKKARLSFFDVPY